MTDEIVWKDGALRPLAQAGIAPDDLGFQVGLAVFETLLWEERAFAFVDRHMLRMERGARALAIPWPPPWDPRQALRELAAELSDEPLAVRLTLTRGRPGGPPTLCVTARAVESPPAMGVELVRSDRVLLPPSDPAAAAGDLKSTSRIVYALAREEARAVGAWDALLATPDGDFAETTIANLFVRRGRRLVTPATGRGCLAGVTRALVLEIASADPPAELDGPPAEGRIEPAELASSDEVFLSNTTGRVFGVRAVRGLVRDLPGSSGPVVRALRASLLDRERAERARWRGSG